MLWDFQLLLSGVRRYIFAQRSAGRFFLPRSWASTRSKLAFAIFLFSKGLSGCYLDYGSEQPSISASNRCVRADIQSAQRLGNGFASVNNFTTTDINLFYYRLEVLLTGYEPAIFVCLAIS